MQKHKMLVLGRLRMGCVVLAAALLTVRAGAATWFPLGPFGGDARSLAADPADSRHLFLGTATGWIYDSRDGGEHWNRISQIGKRNDLVIDHIVVDQANPKRLVVGAYTVDHLADGGIFISEDYGKNWYSQAEMRGQSVRSVSRSISDPKKLVAGTLHGVFLSDDNGTHWKQISPEGSAEINEVQSIAIDPEKPDVIYAGTWHLPWKTNDGGATWSNIKAGIIDDSDVFSIIVDPKDPKVVYASACSGIYKSTNEGELFHKVQGIPSAARRTRTLEQDPKNLSTVFAGTTEGLYRTTDAGSHWDRLTPADVIVNDVYVDPANTNHVLMATDRGGVFRSEDGGVTFQPSNDGFSARQVIAYSADAQQPGTVFVGVVNDKTTGGVFESVDGGVRWQQQSEGLGGRDVFSLLYLPGGTLLAGTAHGVFRWQDGNWADSSAVEGTALQNKSVNGDKPVTLTAPTRLTSPTPRSGTGRTKPRPTALNESRSRTAMRSRLHRAAAPQRTARPRTQGSRSRLVLAKTKIVPRSALPRQTADAHQNAAKTTPTSEKKESDTDRFDGVVYALGRSKDTLFAGTSSGLLISNDNGQHWNAASSLEMQDVHYVATVASAAQEADQPMVLVASLQHLALSTDRGVSWSTLRLPSGLTQIGAAAIDSDKNLWIGGREGVWLSTDGGVTWKTLNNLFLTEVDNIYDDPVQKRVLVTASNSPVAFNVSLPDHKVTYWNTGWMLRFVRPVGDHLLGATLFDGIVVQPKMVDTPETAAAVTGR